MGMTIFDIVTVAGGIILLVNPNWAYNVGRREKQDPPKNWPIIARVLGVTFLLIGAWFIWQNLR